MTDLVTLLARERGWRRWRIPVVLGATILAASGAVAIASTRSARVDPENACDGGADELAAVWNPSQRESIAARLDGAGEARDLVMGALDHQANAWTAMHRSACVAHARGAESAQVLDMRMRCLRQRRFELGAAVDALTSIADTALDHAVDVTADLAPIDDCANLDQLTRELPPPPSAAARARGDVLRAELARLEALDRTGQSEPAITGLDALITDARNLDDPSLLVDALLLRGRIAQVRLEIAVATSALREAATLAFDHGATRAATEASARRLYVEAMDGRDTQALTAQAEILEPLARSLKGDTFAAPLLLNNLGAMRLAAGDPQDARTYFERAKSLVDQISDPRLELLVIDRNLALTTTGAASEQLARRTFENLRRRLGSSNLTTLDAMMVAAHLTRDPERALSLADEITVLTRKFHPGAIEIRLDEARHAAFTAADLDDPERQRTFLTDAVALQAPPDNLAILARYQLATADLALLDGRLDAARDAYVAADRVLLGSPNWWDREFGAAGLVGLATIARARGDDRTAMRQLDEAIAIYVDTVAKGNNQDPMRRLARARVMRAELARAHRDVDLAARLEAAALAYYRSTEAPAYAAIIARLSAAAPQQPPPSQQP